MAAAPLIGELQRISFIFGDVIVTSSREVLNIAR